MPKGKGWQSLLSYPVSNSLEDEWHRRDTGAAAVVQYCDVLEGGPLRGRPKQKAPESASPTGPIAQPKDLQQTRSDIDPCKVPAPIHGKPLRATREYLENAKQPEACFQCFATEGLPDKVRFQMFHNPGCVTRHFDAIHLKEEPLKCNWCEVGLLHRMAFQRHASDVHRTGHESTKPLTRYPFTSNLEWNRICRIQREYRPEKFHTNPPARGERARARAAEK
ncbi:hypothetical protein N7530_002366 [Penicillium desertorum]|uniref:C2H2-type domain-containing protein n=1 Tax=Penicillium desertorum TaxID=1303715 RepID=A0A9W9WDI3_9EURO|nr:hypothetical protein N7530_012795 [Penicillium desertorum]KAJ5483120.1 hypothetical protein N7530_002366 [Penicillium desertorum]